jgi:hypothetical protein
MNVLLIKGGEISVQDLMECINTLLGKREQPIKLIIFKPSTDLRCCHMDDVWTIIRWNLKETPTKINFKQHKIIFEDNSQLQIINNITKIQGLCKETQYLVLPYSSKQELKAIYARTTKEVILCHL